jgi:putative ABC transport system permease protein
MENPDPEVNRLPVIKGKGLAKNDTSGVVIEASYAAYHGIDVGDTLLLHLGAAAYPCHIRGIVLSAEHMCVTSNPLSFIPEEGELAVVFGTLERISDRLGFKMANSLLVRLTDNTDRLTAVSIISDYLEHEAIEGIVPRERQYSYQFLERDLKALGIFAPAVKLTLGLLSFLIAFLNSQRIVYVQRRELGILRALGYRSHDIVGWATIMGLIIGILGLSLGLPVTMALRTLFSEIYAKAIGLARVDQHFFMDQLIGPGAIALLMPVGSLFFGVLRLGNLSPHLLLRPLKPLNECRSRILRILLPPTSTLRIDQRWALRNLARRPLITTITICAVSAAIGVAVAYRVSQRSMRETARTTIENEKWDRQVEFRYPAYPEEYEALLAPPGITHAEPYLAIPSEVETRDGRNCSAVIAGTTPQSELRHIEILSGTALMGVSEHSVLLSPDMEQTLRVGVGDTITLRVPGTSPVKVSVAGVTRNVVFNQVLTSLGNAQRWSRCEDQVNGVLLRVDQSRLPEDWLSGNDLVVRSHNRAELLEDISAIIDKEIAMVNITMVISMGIGALFLLTSLNVAAGERLGEYATMRALGYDAPLLRTILHLEAFAQVVLAGIVALPVGLLVSKFLNQRLAVAWFPLTLAFGALEILPPLVGMIAFSIPAVFPVYRQILHADLPQLLRLRNVE